MIKRAVLIALFMISGFASAEMSIVMKGRWTAVCDGVWISQHNRYDKALEAVINQNTDCDILPPQRFEIRLKTEPEPVPVPVPVPEPPTAKHIEISWDRPTELEDGTALERIDRYNIYYYFKGVLQEPVAVEADSTLYTLANTQAGTYTFQVTAVSEGVESKKSSTTSIQVIN